MPRPLFDQALVHPAIRDRIADWGVGIVKEVQQAIEANRVVVVGMKMNPAPKKARRLLESAGIEHTYLEYGSYLSGWRKRLPLKLWTGWQTFPMVFVNGVLVGGASDLARLMASGKLDEMLKQDSEKT
jgi:glutaredoxin-related protein